MSWVDQAGSCAQNVGAAGVRARVAYLGEVAGEPEGFDERADHFSLLERPAVVLVEILLQARHTTVPESCSMERAWMLSRRKQTYEPAVLVVGDVGDGRVVASRQPCSDVARHGDQLALVDGA